jgi:hypothetical protein
MLSGYRGVPNADLRPLRRTDCHPHVRFADHGAGMGVWPPSYAPLTKPAPQPSAARTVRHPAGS